jgi:hypothetical protein
MSQLDVYESIFTTPNKDWYDSAAISPPRVEPSVIADLVEKTAPSPWYALSQEIPRFLQFERVI